MNTKNLISKHDLGHFSYQPQYSILLCNQPIQAYEKQISTWLSNGIKVIWFTKNQDEIQQLIEEYSPYAKEFLLMAYPVSISQSTVIIDGKDKEAFVTNVLSKACPQFNSAQYLVEHCAADEHIVVQASAGTGKTKVMIDRILYLMHTIPDLKMSEIFMITFTNDAADQMNQRLQDILMTRYRLTGNIRYFQWLEEQSQMNISTIHSFAYNMLKVCGIGQGFTKNLSIKSLKYERKKLIKDMMDEKIREASSIQSQFGLSLYQTASLLDEYWNSFASLGISYHDMPSLKWGKPLGSRAEAFQSLISSAIGDLDQRYFQIKRETDSVSINDIIRDLRDVLLEDNLTLPDLSMKYLFIDEFQDSDLSQIKVAVLFVQMLQAKLFVVGDVKQSIYRFRGATDQAFEILYQSFNEIHAKPARRFILVNNYRTAANIMKRMNAYFAEWGKMELLSYDGPVLPFNKHNGIMKMIPGYRDQDAENDLIVKTIQEQLICLEEEIAQSKKSPSSKDRVVVLTRTNTELKTVSALLQSNKIPVTVSQEGSFFTSEAVRDFYSLIGSYVFSDEPKYIFQYLLTPYGGRIEPMDLHIMEQFDGNYDMLIDYLGHFLEQTSWARYHKEFRLRPVLSVIKSILDQEPVIETFIANAKKRKLDAGWSSEMACKMVRTEALQYQANLEKLLVMLQQTMGNGQISLYDIYHYLELQIATNRTESEPVIETEDDYHSVLCMTIHKSKGLEFDTVVIPYTNRKFPDQFTTEILIDPLTKEVGWNYTNSSKNVEMRNDRYRFLKDLEVLKTKKEETRILYVAMTRAINRLFCIVHPAKDQNRWSYLIEEVGVDDE